jgi:hypothetical protein
MNNQIKGSTNSGPLILGSLMILAGILFLVANYLPADIGQYGWPFFVIAAGAGMLAVGLLTRPVSGLVIPGSIVSVVGTILLVQNTFDLWATWSYAWPLVFPGAVGAGIAIKGLVDGQQGQVVTGRSMVVAGLILFAVFGAFFEGLLHIGGLALGPAGNLLVPFILIGAGIAYLAWTLRSRTTTPA